MTQQGSTPFLSFSSLSSPRRYKPLAHPSRPNHSHALSPTRSSTLLSISLIGGFAFLKCNEHRFPGMPPQTDDDDWSLQSGRSKIVWAYLAHINELKLFYTTTEIHPPPHCHHHFLHPFPFLSPRNVKLHTASGRRNSSSQPTTTKHTITLFNS